MIMFPGKKARYGHIRDQYTKAVHSQRKRQPGSLVCPQKAQGGICTEHLPKEKIIAI